MNQKIIGKRLLVRKEKIDVGALRLQPETEKDGQKNSGTVLGVGQIGILARLHGVKEGAKICFRKHFTTNVDSQDEQVFVELEDVLSIEL